MRSTTWMAVVFWMMGMSPVNAGGKGASEGSPEYKPVVMISAIGFSARLEGQSVVAEWKRYKRPDFHWYKLMRSSSNPNPVYPDDPALFVGTSADQTRYEDHDVSPGTHHYRVCIITLDGHRWVSPVETIQVTESATTMPPTPDDFE